METGKIDAPNFGVSAQQEQDAFLSLLKVGGHQETALESHTAETDSNTDAPAPSSNDGELESADRLRAPSSPASAPSEDSSSLTFPSMSFQDSPALGITPNASTHSLDFAAPASSTASAAALLSSPVTLSLLATPCPDATADALDSVSVMARSSPGPQTPFARSAVPRRQTQTLSGMSGASHPLDDAVSRIEARVLQQHEQQTDVDEAQVQLGVSEESESNKADGEKPAFASAASASVDSATTAASSSVDSSPTSSPPRVTWTPGFRLPLGAEGRQVLLRRLRRAYHASPPETRDTFLASHGLVFSRMPFATVSELFHLAHLLGVFDFAVQCSEEFGGVSSATAVAGRGNRSGVHSSNASVGAVGASEGASGEGSEGLRVGASAKRRRATLQRHAAPSPQAVSRTLRAQAPQRWLHGPGAEEAFGEASVQSDEAGTGFVADGAPRYLPFEDSAEADQLSADLRHSADSSPVSARRTPRGLKKRRRRPLAHAPSRHNWAQAQVDEHAGACSPFGWSGGLNEVADCMHGGALASDLLLNAASRSGFFGAERRVEAAKIDACTQKQLLQILQQLGLFNGELEGAANELGDTDKFSAAVQALQMQLQALTGNSASHAEKAAPAVVPRRTGVKRAVGGHARRASAGIRKRRDIADRLSKEELRNGEADSAYCVRGPLFNMQQPGQKEVLHTPAKAAALDFLQVASRDALSDHGQTRQESLTLSVASSLPSLAEETTQAPSLETLLARSLAAIGNGQDCASLFGPQICLQADRTQPASSERDFFQFVDEFKTRMDATEDAVAAKQADASLEELTREREALLRSFLQGDLSQVLKGHEGGEIAADNQEALLLSLLQKPKLKRPLDFPSDSTRLLDGATSAEEPFQTSQGLLDVSPEALRGLSSQALQASRPLAAAAFPGADSGLGSALLQLLQNLPTRDMAVADRLLPAKAAAVPAPASTNAQYAVGLQFLRLVELFQLHNNLSGLLGALPKIQCESGLAPGVEEELKRGALAERDDGAKTFEPLAVRATPVTTGEDSNSRNGTSWGSGCDSLRSRSGSFSDRTSLSMGSRLPAGTPCILRTTDTLAEGVRSSFTTCCSEGLPATAVAAPRSEALSYPNAEECLQLKLSRQGARVC
ncbi:hypothetical protein TGVAND_281960 [Toxoplasma gondii VAND]|uniref:Uncharacterized protein n=3 Tax=Toxoplasma gondii TaxID=5811 RepID=A0A2T6IFA6_TOXGO|nr:hypothetical protein TGP89_281960 [Toxoplasma gondii p89]KFH00247.1 hypothetical protein TGVAND_281960 [Toxoplasma gondii VAND]PUA84017.1 hypothetical protein TGBR9_281960 [Toxoplasma gondii TgCATBr9]